MKNILMIAYTNIPSDSRVRRESEALAEYKDWHVEILVLREGDRPRTYVQRGVVIRELDMRKYQGRNLLKYFMSYLRFGMLAMGICSGKALSGKLDVLHVHNMPNFFVFSGLLPRVLGKKIILDVHDTMIETFAATYGGRFPGLVRALLRLEERLSCRFAHRLICVNDIQKDAMVKRGIPAEKITTVLNVPDDKIVDHGRHIGAKSANERFRIIYHGTLTQRLGIDLAIQAVVKLHPEFPKMDFTILGNGDGREDFMRLASDLGARDFVHFRKTVPFDEMLPILEGMDLEVVPNRKSQASDLMLPVKMMECAALGIPVVAPRLKAIQHYFPEDAIFYFDPDDMESMISALRKALSNRDLCIAKSIEARKFLETYGWPNHKHILLGLYDVLCEQEERV